MVSIEVKVVIIRVISFIACSRELMVDLVKDYDMDKCEVIYKAPKEGAIYYFVTLFLATCKWLFSAIVPCSYMYM